MNHHTRVLTALAALTLAAGCTVGPDFTRPDAPAGGYQHAAPPATAQRRFEYGSDVAEDWYQMFHSPALAQLVSQALAGNPTLEAARHGLAAAQYELQAVAGQRAAAARRHRPASPAPISTAASSMRRTPTSSRPATSSSSDRSSPTTSTCSAACAAASSRSARRRPCARPGAQHLRDAGRSGGDYRFRLRRHRRRKSK